MNDELSKLSIDTIKYYIKYLTSKIADIRIMNYDGQDSFVMAMDDGKVIAYCHCIKMLEDILRIEDRSQFNEKLKVKDGID